MILLLVRHALILVPEMVAVWHEGLEHRETRVTQRYSMQWMDYLVPLR